MAIKILAIAGIYANTPYPGYGQMKFQMQIKDGKCLRH
jgi:hypothetical protein